MSRENEKDYIKQCTISNIVVRLFDPKRNKPKPSPNDATFSVDVNIIDENGVHGLAYFCFEDNKWIFHTDTLVDYDEVGAETKWVWYYPVLDKNDVRW